MKIFTSILIGVALVGLVGYLPSWTDNRETNATPRTGASKFFTELHSSMIRSIPVKDELGWTQQLVWSIGIGIVIWFIRRRTP